MLADATSLADFFRKAEKDDRYKAAAVQAHQSSEGVYNGGWIAAEKWINNWAKKYVKPDDVTSMRRTCYDMTTYLNRYIRRIC